MRQVLIYPGEDGYWVVECQSLPGCISPGKTYAKILLQLSGQLLYANNLSH